MNYLMDNNSRLPAYLQLYQQLREDIINGAYPYGSKLPSKRTLSVETGVSVITVKHAIELLSDEGYIETRIRSGCFVIFRKDDFQDAAFPIRETPLHSDVQHRVESHKTGEFPYSVLAKTMRKVILDYGEKILTKSPNHGCAELRTEICAYLARSRGIHISPHQVIIGSGAEYLYGLIAQMMGQHIRFAIENPSYDKIRKVYEAFGISCDLLTLRSDGIDSAQLRQTNAAVLHTTPFNSFPSGISVGAPKKHEYLQWAALRNGIIIEDNFDSELTVSSKAEDSLFSMSGGQNVIYVNTFSKTIAPSVRIGYMILPENMVELYNEKLGFYSCTVPVFDQYVLTELLRSGDFERHINRMRRKKRKELAKW